MKKKLAILWLSCWLCAMAFADNWMGRLPDDTYVAVVSIPGAHDAATGSGWNEGLDAWGDLYARTQDLDIASQWSAGIRAFDLRPCVYEDYMSLNHGIMPTTLHFDEALCLLRDSLIANPSEFVIIHLLHETNGDQVTGVYNQRLLELLRRDDLKDYLVDFKTDLRVDDVRGKMLILSRDRYASLPIGGFLEGWTGEINIDKQTAGTIIGKATADTGKLYMQDYSDTHGTDGITQKVTAIQQMLRLSTKHKTTTKPTIRWVFNFASGYSKVETIFGIDISTSDGYRDNATYTHEAFIQFLETNDGGPTGIVLMDFAGVDDSGDYHVRGKELTDAIINNNFRYLDDTSAIKAVPSSASARQTTTHYTILGQTTDHLVAGHVYLYRDRDGNIKKTIIR